MFPGFKLITSIEVKSPSDFRWGSGGDSFIAVLGGKAYAGRVTNGRASLKPLPIAHGDTVRSIDYHGGGRYVVAIANAMPQIVEEGRVLSTESHSSLVEHKQPAHQLTAKEVRSIDGDRYAAILWNPVSGRGSLAIVSSAGSQILDSPTPVDHVAVSPCGRYIVISAGIVSLRDLKTLKTAWEDRAYAGQVMLHRVAWSPDSTRIAICHSTHVPAVSVADVASGPKLDVPLPFGPCRVAWFPDGRHLYSEGLGGRNLIDSSTWSRIESAEEFPNLPALVRHSPFAPAVSDTGTLCTYEGDNKLGNLSFWSSDLI